MASGMPSARRVALRCIRTISSRTAPSPHPANPAMLLARGPRAHRPRVGALARSVAVRAGMDRTRAVPRSQPNRGRRHAAARSAARCTDRSPPARRDRDHRACGWLACAGRARRRRQRWHARTACRELRHPRVGDRVRRRVDDRSERHAARHRFRDTAERIRSVAGATAPAAACSRTAARRRIDDSRAHANNRAAIAIRIAIAITITITIASTITIAITEVARRHRCRSRARGGSAPGCRRWNPRYARAVASSRARRARCDVLAREDDALSCATRRRW